MESEDIQLDDANPTCVTPQDTLEKASELMTVWWISPVAGSRGRQQVVGNFLCARLRVTILKQQG